MFRKFALFLPDGGLRHVVQIQSKEWHDLTAPKEPRYSQKSKDPLLKIFISFFRVLMDLIYKSHDLSKEIGKYVFNILETKSKTLLPQIPQGILQFLSTAAQALEGRAPSSRCTSCGWTTSTWRSPSWTSWTRWLP